MNCQRKVLDPTVGFFAESSIECDRSTGWRVCVVSGWKFANWIRREWPLRGEHSMVNSVWMLRSAEQHLARNWSTDPAQPDRHLKITVMHHLARLSFHIFFFTFFGTKPCNTNRTLRCRIYAVIQTNTAPTQNSFRMHVSSRTNDHFSKRNPTMTVEQVDFPKKTNLIVSTCDGAGAVSVEAFICLMRLRFVLCLKCIRADVHLWMHLLSEHVCVCVCAYVSRSHNGKPIRFHFDQPIRPAVFLPFSHTLSVCIRWTLAYPAVGWGAVRDSQLVRAPPSDGCYTVEHRIGHDRRTTIFKCFRIRNRFFRSINEFWMLFLFVIGFVSSSAMLKRIFREVREWESA